MFLEHKGNWSASAKAQISFSISKTMPDQLGSHVQQGLCQGASGESMSGQDHIVESKACLGQPVEIWLKPRLPLTRI